MRVDLCPVGEVVPPECGPVTPVEIFQRAVTPLQKVVKPCQTLVAVTDGAVFIADMPARESGMGVVAFREFFIHADGEFAENGRVVTCALAGHPWCAAAVLANQRGFRIALSHPARTGGGRRGEEDLFSAFGTTVHDPVEP